MENFNKFLEKAIQNNLIDLKQAIKLSELLADIYPGHDLVPQCLISTGNPIEDVLTVTEAAELWGKDRTTLIKNNEYKRYIDKEVRKAKGTWLITKSAMVRLYGPAPKKQDNK